MTGCDDDAADADADADADAGADADADADAGAEDSGADAIESKCSSQPFKISLAVPFIRHEDLHLSIHDFMSMPCEGVILCP